jgi:hypothetical protein
MIRLGLCSNSCITCDARGVIAAAAAAGLDTVEWASDAHLGAGEHRAAEELMIATLTAGLSTASYSTLYQAGAEDGGFKRFDAFLAIAAILQSPLMRIYACGERGAEAGADRQGELASELRRLGDRAAVKGITLCLSMGRGTGFDGYDRAAKLVAETAHDFVRLAWEDLPTARPEEATGALEGLGGQAGLLIARCSSRDGRAKGVAEEAAAWRTRLGAFKRAEKDAKMSRFVLLGSPRSEGEAGAASLAADAAALREIITELEPPKKRG